MISTEILKFLEETKSNNEGFSFGFIQGKDKLPHIMWYEYRFPDIKLGSGIQHTLNKEFSLDMIKEDIDHLTSTEQKERLINNNKNILLGEFDKPLN